MNRTIATALTLGLALLTLTACSGAPTHEQKDTPGPTVTHQTRESTPTVYDECVDDLATIDAARVKAGTTFSLGDCAHVSVVGQASKGTTIELGTVEDLLVEGSGTTVSVASAKSITVPGSDNTVIHDPGAEVQDLGKGNTLTVR